MCKFDIYILFIFLYDLIMNEVNEELVMWKEFRLYLIINKCFMIYCFFV